MANEEKNKLKDFIFDSEVYLLTAPSAGLIREAKHAYSRVYTQSLRDGLFTRKKLEAFLKEDQSEVLVNLGNRRVEIIQQIVETKRLIDEATDPNMLEQLAELMATYRAALVEEEQSVNSMFSHTAEEIAEDERINVLTVGMVKDGAGAPVWKDVNELLEDARFSFVEFCKYQVICWDYKLDPEWQEKLPEREAWDKAEKIRKEQAELEEKKEQEKLEKKAQKKKTAAEKKSIAADDEDVAVKEKVPAKRGRKKKQ